MFKGVGNVVLHVSAMTKCKRCYGFEKAEWPAFYASRMEKEFKFWMNFFGKTFSDFRVSVNPKHLHKILVIQF